MKIHLCALKKTGYIYLQLFPIITQFYTNKRVKNFHPLVRKKIFSHTLLLINPVSIKGYKHQFISFKLCFCSMKMFFLQVDKVAIQVNLELLKWGFPRLFFTWLRTCLMNSMKKLILFSILGLALTFSASAQSISQYAFNSGSGEATSVLGENVQFTIGQAFITNTLTDNNATYITQGFEQPSSKNFVTARPEFEGLELVKLVAYPNPAVDYTDLVLNLIDKDGAKVTMVDMWGQNVKSEDFRVDEGQQKLHFKFGALAVGMYTINVVANKTAYSKKIMINGGGTSATY